MGQSGGTSKLAAKRAAAQKAAATRRKLYGPDGPMRGRERHKVKSVGEIADRLKARLDNNMAAAADEQERLLEIAGK
jgi:hypothetical protein